MPSTQAQRTLLLYRLIRDGGAIDVVGADKIFKDNGIGPVSVRTIQRDLKMIADSLDDVAVHTSGPGGSVYTLCDIDSELISKRKPIKRSNQDSHNTDTQLKPRLKKDVKKVEENIPDVKKDSDEVVVPAKVKNKAASVESTPKKLPKKKKILPKGFNQIDEDEIFAQKYLKNYRKAKVKDKDTEKLLKFFQRNSISEESVKINKKGLLSINLKKMKAKDIATLIKKFENKLTFE